MIAYRLPSHLTTINGENRFYSQDLRLITSAMLGLIGHYRPPLKELKFHPIGPRPASSVKTHTIPDENHVNDAFTQD